MYMRRGNFIAIGRGDILHVMAINGSPRREWNTATLLKQALAGAAAEGARTKLVHLYDLRYRGCVSCFSCKKKGIPHGVCAMRDELSPVLERMQTADVILFGSPIYLMNLSSGMSACMERFLYPGTIYSDAVPSVFPKKIGTGFIYTMNMTEEQVRSYELEQKWEIYHFFTKAVLGIEPKVLYSYDTRQFSDYTQYESSRFSAADKQHRYEEQFPKDCQAARKLGEKLAQEAADR
jgi:multimeric flavodoxin WrbA